MNPFIHFTKTIFKHGFQVKYLPRVLSFYFKYLLFEVFRLTEKVLYTKKIKHHKIEKDPVFILGYYRSGTTHLQELLLQDTHFGYMNYFQGIAVNSFLVSEKFLRPILSRIIKLFGVQNPAHNLPLTMEMTMEEDIAMVSSGFYLASNWGQVLPHRFKHFFNKTVFFKDISDSEYKDFKQNFQLIVNKTSIANDQKQLIFKSPPQLARIKMLMEMYPEAKFIYIHRNPYHVFKSNLRLWKTFDGQKLSSISDNDIRENIVWSYDESMKLYQEYKVLIPKKNIFELSFDDLQKTPLDSIKSIYKQFNLDLTDITLKTMQHFLDQKHGKNRAIHKINEADSSLVENKLSRWLELYNYKKPSSN